MAPRDKDPFVKMPVWWAVAAAKATKTPELVVMVELLRRQFGAGSMTVPLPNARLAKLGVSRKVKYRVLRDLERAKLITVGRSSRKTPSVTLVLL